MSNLHYLQKILIESPVGLVLPAITKLNLPNWWLAGGAVRNTVWRYLYPDDCNLVINDFDIAFFNLDGDRNEELFAKQKITQEFPSYEFDIKNQASFTRWRQGTHIFMSTEDAIAQWLHTATSVSVRLDSQGEWEFFTPYGLDDLFNGVIRATPGHIDNPDAEKKGVTFLQKCPHLKLAPK
jgi:uncharacterized protein